MKNIANLVKEANFYADSMRAATQTKDEALKYINETYLPNSKAHYNETMKVTGAFNESVEPVKKNYREAVTNTFAEARKKLAEVVTAPIPEEVVKIAPILNNLGDFEKQALKEKYAGNYLAMKTLNADNEDFKTLEHIIADMKELEDFCGTLTNKSIDCYDSMIIRKGDWTSRVATEVNEFINTYGADQGEPDAE